MNPVAINVALAAVLIALALSPWPARYRAR